MDPMPWHGGDPTHTRYSYSKSWSHCLYQTICLTWKVGAVRLPCIAMFLAGQTETLGLFQPFRPWSKKNLHFLATLSWLRGIILFIVIPQFSKNIPSLITTPYRTWNFDIRHCSTNKMQNKFDIRPLKYGNDMGGFPWKGVPVLRLPGKNHEKKLSDHTSTCYVVSSSPPGQLTFDPGSPSKFALRQALVPSLDGWGDKVRFWLVWAAKKITGCSGNVDLCAKMKHKDVSIFWFFSQLLEFVVGFCLLLLRGSYMENSWSHRSSILVVSMSNSISLP